MDAGSPRTASDFRSDTVTRPDAQMRAAMAEADVGDDVFGDDFPTIRLESAAANVLGKEAALFLPSGTMANQVAVRVHTSPGDEVLLHEGCHVYRFEQGGLAALHGVQAVPMPGEGGVVGVAAFAAAIRPDDAHYPRSRLIVLENTHNFSGGRILPQAYVEEVGRFSKEHGLRLHLDGARLANAAIALGLPFLRLAAPADSVSLCLSKGLGAPVGTVLAGTDEFIAKARRARKLLGGGMRQTGILAAAGFRALMAGWQALAEDHRRARRLAEAFAGFPAVSVVPPETNIVVMTIAGCDIPKTLAELKSRGVLASAFGAGRLRFVTHKDVGDADVERAVAALEAILAARRGNGTAPPI